MRVLNLSIKFILIVILAFELCFTGEAKAGVKENIGGGGSSSGTSESSSSSNTALTAMYVLAGAAVAFAAWHYFSEKSAAEEDSTQAMLKKPLYDFNNTLAFKSMVIEQKLFLTINLYLNDTIYNDRKYFMGVKVKFWD
jgi:hypothetical protein